MRLRGKVAVVTGASRKAGRGIARALGQEGAVVYVTGRTSRNNPSPTGRPETIEDTADQVRARGAECIPIVCDHGDDSQVKALFERVESDHGRLDILVSNAWGGYERSVEGRPVWELDPDHLDLMYRAGLRSHIVSAQLAAPLLQETRGGLVVVTTWAIGAVGVPAPPRLGPHPPYHGHLYYDVIKTAINRIPVGLAAELRPYDVSAVAVSPGAIYDEDRDTTSEWARRAESPEFVGRAIAALASDPTVGRHSGSLLTVDELAVEYGFTDVNGKQMSAMWEAWRRNRRGRYDIDSAVIP